MIRQILRGEKENFPDGILPWGPLSLHPRVLIVIMIIIWRWRLKLWAAHFKVLIVRVWNWKSYFLRNLFNNCFASRGTYFFGLFVRLAKKRGLFCGDAIVCESALEVRKWQWRCSGVGGLFGERRKRRFRICLCFNSTNL